MSNQIDPPVPESSDAKLPYHKPELRIYGDVTELTASSGLSSPNSDAGTSQFCTQNPTYPTCRTS